MPVIGSDCHITLQHPAVNAGQPYGFFLDRNSRSRPEGIAITRQVITGLGLCVWVYFDILLADGLLNPDGSLHAASRETMYAMLMQYLEKTDGIILTTPIGALLDLGAVGFTADEVHLPQASLMRCQLNNVGYYFAPVDPAVLANSVWDGALTWASSYWR